MMRAAYTTPLTVTNQFYFCGLPLRLDTFRGCAFHCGFCFARRRGGNAPNADVVPADPAHIKRIIDRALGAKPPENGMVAQFLRRRVPIHFGGMSDPFQEAELRFRITEQALQILSAYEYPTIISTRSTLVASPRYLSILSAMPYVIVQFSMSTSDDGIASRTEPRSPSPSEVLRAMEQLAKSGIAVTCRWQPFIPGVSEDCIDFVRRVASAGSSHIGFEHLKVPLERRDSGWRDFNRAVGQDLFRIYQAEGARRDGREYILPPTVKRQKIVEVAALTRKHGMSFGAADNEFQYLSDTACCCSGADRFPGFENFFKHQIAYAVRKCKNTRITYDAIEHEWAPEGSIDRFLNSKSRITRRTGGPSTIRDHIRKRWNDAGTPGSPGSYFGVRLSTTTDGMSVYEWDRSD